MIRKILIFILIIGGFIISDIPKISGGNATIMPTTIIGADDSVFTGAFLVSSSLQGYFTLTYAVDSIDGAVALKLYYEETNDTAVGWHNRTLIDSITTIKSATVDFRLKAVTFVRWLTQGFGVTGDTSDAIIILNAAK